MGGDGGGGGGIIPFNMAALAPFMPSIFKGPYNVQGAYQNEKMIANKYPWITPPAGQFEGAQPGQFAGSGGSGMPGPFGMMFGGGLPGVSGFQPPPNPNPPVPPTVQPGAQMNPMQMTGGQVNAMQPNSLQSILSVLNAGAPSGGQ